jgi:hypothetical protein
MPPGSPYGQTQPGQGTWPQQASYGYPPPQQGYPPQVPYGYPAGSSFVVPPQRSSFWTSGWGIYWMIRLGIALVFILLAGVGACFSMLSH